MDEQNNKTYRELIVELANDIKWIKLTHTATLESINKHLEILNGRVSENTKRSISVESSTRVHWKLICVIMGVGGGIMGILLGFLR